MKNEYTSFLKQLKITPMTVHQYHTLRGQALSGDLQGAQKGLNNIMNRRNSYAGK